MKDFDVRIGTPGCNNFLSVLDEKRIQDKVNINKENGVKPLMLLALLKDELSDLKEMHEHISSKINSGDIKKNLAEYRRIRLCMDVQILNLIEQIEYIEKKYVRRVK